MDGWRKRGALGAALGAFFFAMDWAGYRNTDPRLFVPKDLKAMWWHLPIWVVAAWLFVLFATRERNE